MKKLALVFIVAVLAPSLVLAWLAMRSVRDQQFVLERQQSLLYQGVADALAKDVDGYLAERQKEFGLQVEALLGGPKDRNIQGSFDERLTSAWPLAEVGFAVSLDGRLFSPSLLGRPEARRFRLENDLFLTSRESAEIYWISPKGAINLSRADTDAKPASPDDNAMLKNVAQTKESKVIRKIVPEKDPDSYFKQAQQFSNTSRVTASSAEFRQLIGDSNEGALARFLQNRLNLLIWYRSPRDPRLVFGAKLNLARVVEGLRGLIRVEPNLHGTLCAALLDENAHPVALSHPHFRADWKRPFVATEIGEALPHWETAIYLLDPGNLSYSAEMLKLTLGLIIAVLILAIGIGGWLIIADLKRELTAARQKTDFVSNVSHELKTPLTSIRLFSELLAEGRVADLARQRSYLQIIAAEAARLTRLINNVLDFSRLERGEKKFAFQQCDLGEVIRETIQTYRPHLETNGFTLECRLPEVPCFTRGDRDALAQVVVNLLSNAEKYSGEHKAIGVEMDAPAGGSPVIRIQVLDRGLGVPRGMEEKIFEKFFRGHDALNSGIQGSGLGLTLARQVARAHGGDLIYQPREGGGSCFILQLPRLTPAP